MLFVKQTKEEKSHNENLKWSTDSLLFLHRHSEPWRTINWRRGKFRESTAGFQVTANRKDWHKIDDEVSPGGNDSEGQPKQDKFIETDKGKSTLSRTARSFQSSLLSEVQKKYFNTRSKSGTTTEWRKAPSVQMNPLFRKTAVTKQLALLKGNSLC